MEETINDVINNQLAKIDKEKEYQEKVEKLRNEAGNNNILVRNTIQKYEGFGETVFTDEYVNLIEQKLIASQSRWEKLKKYLKQWINYDKISYGSEFVLDDIYNKISELEKGD